MQPLLSVPDRDAGTHQGKKGRSSSSFGEDPRGGNSSFRRSNLGSNSFSIGELSDGGEDMSHKKNKKDKHQKGRSGSSGPLDFGEDEELSTPKARARSSSKKDKSSSKRR